MAENEPTAAGREKLQADFRDAMRAFAAPVSLITVREQGGDWRGMAASSVSSLCMEPPSILLAIDRASSTLETIRRVGRICVNCLSCDQQDVVAVFASERRRSERFRVGDWSEGPNGSPWVVGARAALFCTVERTVDYGTHTILMNRVEAVRLTPSGASAVVSLEVV